MGNELTPREATYQVRLNRWQQIFADRNSSGLTVMEYCKRNGLTKDQYYYWLRKSKEAIIESNSIVFAELAPRAVTGESAYSGSVITLRIDGVNIDINGTVDEEMLTAIIRAVRNA